MIGSGQTGVQLSEELHLAGRDVVLACGRAPWLPRRADGLDLVTWLERTTLFDQQLSELPSPANRLLANIQMSGARGGHDLHYRVLRDLGVTLAGRLRGVSHGRALFADDLAESVAFATPGTPTSAPSCASSSAPRHRSFHNPNHSSPIHRWRWTSKGSVS